MIRVLCFLVCSILMGQAWAACSSYKGLATINEIYERNNGDHFIEVKLLAASLTSADYNSWTVRACRRTNVCSSSISLSGAIRSDVWLALDNVGDTNIDLNGGMDVILRDGSGNTIDYMTMENYTPQRDNTCSTAYDWQHFDSINNTDNVYRNADGVGDWDSTPGNSSQDTERADNSQNLPFGAPQLSVNNVVAEQGTALLFTFTLSATFSSAVSITYQTVNDTALSGTHYTATSGTLTIPAGSTSATVSVPTIDSTETNSVRMFMQISSATNASVIGAIGIGTILNNNFVADWRMDEASWNGTSNEAVDSSGNGYHGTAAAAIAAGSTALPTTASVSSAYTSGSQSTCGYGQFDTSASPTRTNGYLAINGAPALTSSFTFTAWIRSTNASRSGQRILVRDDAQNGWGFSLGDPGSARVRFFNRNIGDAANLTGNGSIACGGGTFCLDTAAVITANNWFYVAVAIDTSARRITHYVFNQAGTLLSNTSATYPNAWVDGSGTLAIGGETINSSEGITSSFHFNGNIDELRIVSGAMSQATVEDMLERTRPCSGSVVVDHYHISHSGNGITCEAEPVTITAHDASHNPVNVTSDTSLTVTTNPAVTSIVSSPVTIASGSSSTTVNIQQTSVLSNIDIDVIDGDGVTEQDGVADHDPALAFADTGLRFYANGVISSIDHQIMNKPSSTAPNTQTLTLRAIRTNTDTMACNAAVTGTRNVSIGFECQNPLACSISGTADFIGNSGVVVAGTSSGNPLTYTSVPMTFDVSGSAPFVFDVNDVGQMQLFASLSVAPSAPNPAFTLTGYSNNFVVRPFGFNVTTTSAVAVDATSDPFIQAGADFPVNLSAVGWQSADDGNGDGAPDPGSDLSNNLVAGNFGNESSAPAVSLDSTLVAPAPAPAQGDLLHTPINFSDGIATTQASFSEVGIIDLNASLGTYQGVAGTMTGIRQGVGRFIPARFDVSVAPGSFTNGCGSFTYIGQSFSYITVPSLSITAQNASGGTTQNYTSGTFQKLVAGDVLRDFPVADGDHTLITTDDALGADGATALAVSTSNTSGTFTSANLGVITYSFANGDSFTYVKNANAEVGPFTANLGIVVTGVEDSDGAAAATLPTAIPDATTTGQRYGRWLMDNAYGPEIMPLTMKAQTQFLDALGNYVVNTQDNCTTLTPTSTSGVAGSGSITGINVGGGTSNFSYNSPLFEGDAVFGFTAPGADNTGSIPISVDLSIMNWLRYDWDGDGALEDHPDVRATFGQYRGHDRIIYWREVEN